MEIVKKRPKLISIVCVLGFIWIVFSFPSVFSPSIKKLGDWYPALFGFIVACNFIAYIGLWHMKKWSVGLYTITFFIKEIILILINDVSYVGLTFSILFIGIMLFFYRYMDINL